MKRERSDTDDDPDVVPLYKRMNNIHFDFDPNVTVVGASGGQGVNGSGPHLQRVPYLPHPTFPPSPPYEDNNNPAFLHHHHGQASAIHPGTPSANQMDQHSHHHSGIMKPFENCVRDARYAPSMDPSQNPLYYEQNKVLFQLYKERLIRTSAEPHPELFNK